MADYPGDIYDPRDIENMPGVVYDADKSTIVYAEDINNANAEIVAIETLLGEFAPPWPYPVSGLLEGLVKFQLSQSRVRVSLGIGPGLIAPESFNLVLADPLGLGRDCEIVATGGVFTVTNPPNPIQTYMMVVSVFKISSTAWRFVIKYFNVGTNAFVSPLAIPFGSTVSANAGFTYDVRWLG